MRRYTLCLLFLLTLSPLTISGQIVIPFSSENEWFTDLSLDEQQAFVNGYCQGLYSSDALFLKWFENNPSIHLSPTQQQQLGLLVNVGIFSLRQMSPEDISLLIQVALPNSWQTIVSEQILYELTRYAKEHLYGN
jgi:hypothetical protein